MKDIQVIKTCDHCGEPCGKSDIKVKQANFCCIGCKSVYALLHDNDLSSFYTYESRPGTTISKFDLSKYEILDDPDILSNIIDFKDESSIKISLQLPQIHCSSCLYLLENLHKIDKGIISSRVNFLEKRATITIDSSLTSIRKLAELLSKIGYEPTLNFDSLDGKKTQVQNNALLYKLGVAGFSFGNIMLFSFPDYLGLEQKSFSDWFIYLNIILVLPVIFYSAKDYFLSSFTNLKYGKLHIDVTVALGITALFGRSLYDILLHVGPGYLDSLSGFVFFLLIGQWFQNLTYGNINFDRNYKSFFPISAFVKINEKWEAKSLDKIIIGDKLLIKNQQIIPTDGILRQGKASIDYSFVTGESKISAIKAGSKIYAGGKQTGGNIILEVEKPYDQSFLTRLWNESSFDDEKLYENKVLEKISKYFIIVILLVALATLAYWLYNDPNMAFNTFTAVLIVACPCALALATPFTYGNVMRILSKKFCYLKNIGVIQNLQKITHIVFDKTGTLTDQNKLEIAYHGKTLNSEQKSWLKSLAFHSSHPLSRAIYNNLQEELPTIDLDKFTEVIGMGLVGKIGNHVVRFGSAKYIFNSDQENSEGKVFIEIDSKYLGFYEIQMELRDGVKDVIDQLQKKYKLTVLSGDSNRDLERMSRLFGNDAQLVFNQTPHDKLKYIKDLQNMGAKVLMIGDGLNDSGALKQSNVGISISDDDYNFTPACDVVLSAKVFRHLNTFLEYCKSSQQLVFWAILLAFGYNSIGLYFAVKGSLSPLIAAILMPASSITIVLFGMASSYILAKKKKII